MTWNEMLRNEASRLHAQESVVVQSFVELRSQARGASTQALLDGLIDEGPSRLTRLDIVLVLVEGTPEGRPLRAFEGWLEDVREMGRLPSRDETHDAAILSALLRMARMRTSCYEVSYLLAHNFGAESAAGLLGAILATDRETDDRVAAVLARVIVEGEGRWDLGSLLP